MEVLATPLNVIIVIIINLTLIDVEIVIVARKLTCSLFLVKLLKKLSLNHKFSLLTKTKRCRPKYLIFYTLLFNITLVNQGLWETVGKVYENIMNSEIYRCLPVELHGLKHIKIRFSLTSIFPYKDRIVDFALYTIKYGS